MKTVLTIQPCEWGIGRLGQLLKHSISFFRLFNIIGTIFFPVTIKIFLCERVFCFCFFLIVISFFLFFLTSMFIYIFFWQSSLQLFLWYDNILEREKKKKVKNGSLLIFSLKFSRGIFQSFDHRFTTEIFTTEIAISQTCNKRFTGRTVDPLKRFWKNRKQEP